MHPTRAVVLGTKKASIIPTKIIPATKRLVLLPIRDKINNAIRLSSPVCVIAAAKNNAAPTKIVALAEIPIKAIFNALPVP